MKRNIRISVILILLTISLAVSAESPRFRGPLGDGKFIATGLLKSWPEHGPPVAWITEGFGMGYSSVSVSDGHLYVTGMDSSNTGHLFILSLDGKILGKITYGPETTDDQATGSRSTPTVDGDRAYILSGLGVVYAFDLVNNKILWQVNILNRYAGENNTWTLAESLWLDGDRLYCTPGGKHGVVVALNKLTGETEWALKEPQDQASYCSPVIITHNGRNILTTMTATNVLGIDPVTGALLWNHEHRTDYDIHAVSPVYGQSLLYYTGGYGSGGGALKLSESGDTVTQAWRDKTLDCQHHGVVLVDGYLYGTSHRKPALVCLELETGNVMWTDRTVTQGNTVYADGMLYIYEGPKIGRVSLVRPDPKGLDLKGQVMVTAGTEKHWAHPTIAHGMLLIRRGDAIIAYDIREK